MKLFRTLVTLFAISVSTSSFAVPIAASDWHLTTDGFGGLKQSWNSTDVFFAVSKIANYNPNDTYETIAGYHFATTAEYIALTDIYNTGGTNKSVCYGQGGWAGYNWEGRDRYGFLFADSYSTGNLLHAGGREVSGWLDGTYSNVSYVTSATTNNLWAGFIMVKDAAVPEPSIALLMASGLIAFGVVRIKRKA